MNSLGVCKLTGAKGKFVKAHLIPRALTRPSEPGRPFIQGGESDRPVLRHDSWYDLALVTQKGEDILRRYDDAGIKELRRHRLVWSSWDGAKSYNGSDLTLFSRESQPDRRIRSISDVDGSALRLFFLSLLWRSAVTDVSGFKEIQLSESEIMTLTAIVLGESADSPDFYPVTLTQIVTRGPTHNLTPFVMDTTHDVGAGEPYRINVFRFYLDGLIAYFHRPDPGVMASDIGALAVGGSPQLAVQCVLAEGSFQIRNLLQARDEAHLQWPIKMAKLSPDEVFNYDARLARYEAIFGAHHPWLVRRG